MIMSCVHIVHFAPYMAILIVIGVASSTRNGKEPLGDNLHSASMKLSCGLLHTREMYAAMG